MSRRVHWSLLCLAVLACRAHGQGSSYTREVVPFLNKYCVECHRAGKVKGNLRLDTYEEIMKGTKKNRRTVVPGDPDNSRLVMTTEHRMKPVMPPKKEKQPSAREAAVLRAWVKAGARNDAPGKVGIIPFAQRLDDFTDRLRLAFARPVDGNILPTPNMNHLGARPQDR